MAGSVAACALLVRGAPAAKVGLIATGMPRVKQNLGKGASRGLQPSRPAAAGRLDGAYFFLSASAATRMRTILSGLLTAPLALGLPFLIWSTQSIPWETLPQMVYLPSR